MDEIQDFMCSVVISAFFCIILVLAKVLFDRRTTDNARDEFEKAKRTAESAGAGIDDAEESVERITDTNIELAESVESDERVLEEIRKQKLPD